MENEIERLNHFLDVADRTMFCDGERIVDLEQKLVRAENALIDRESETDELIKAEERKVETVRKWSARWKALARFRGWPASKHEENRRRLRDALREIAKGEGRYSRDPLEHAANTIEDMQAIARKALAER